ncbi:AAA family ATPase [Devriesea agamarum]|uniref:AAA family ATPase n=1 Tax=Devriesea agamarum TaxID=472569 RepID=UPI000B2C4950
MHIRNVTVENVKSFRKKHRFDLKPGVNFFVGDNNSGKSTVLEALLFTFEGPSAICPWSLSSPISSGYRLTRLAA